MAGLTNGCRGLYYPGVGKGRFLILFRQERCHLMPALIVLGVLLFVVLIVAMILVGMYNGLVTLRNRYKNAFSQIDVQLKRRNDLIPNLVEVAKGYIKHETRDAGSGDQGEKTSPTRPASRRPALPGDAQAMGSLGAAEAQLSGALGRLFAVAESYPDLKANQNMLSLQEELSSTENKIAFAPSGVQRLGDGIQHPARGFSHVDHRLDVQFSRGDPLPDRSSRGAGGTQGFLQLIISRPAGARYEPRLVGHRFLLLARLRPTADHSVARNVRAIGVGDHPGIVPGCGRRAG